MAEIENVQEFGCPYCMAMNSVAIEPAQGKRQRFVTDCENCCRPILVRVTVEADGYVDLTVQQEGE